MSAAGHLPDQPIHRRTAILNHTGPLTPDQVTELERAVRDGDPEAGARDWIDVTAKRLLDASRSFAVRNDVPMPPIEPGTFSPTNTVYNMLHTRMSELGVRRNLPDAQKYAEALRLGDEVDAVQEQERQDRLASFMLPVDRTKLPARQETLITRQSRIQLRDMIARDLAKAEYDRMKAAEEAEDWDELYLDQAALAALVTPPALIGGILPRGANVILRGRDGTFKSFVALDWALSVATGTSWCYLPTETGPVLYIAGEGAYGMKDRVAAWLVQHGITDPIPFTLRKQALNLHAPGPAFEHLLGWIREHKPVLVVIDTLRRVSGSAEGNGSEMGRVVDSIDAVKQAMAEWGGTTVTVTHTDKGDHDTRGFSGIEDDIDVVFHAKRPDPEAPRMTLLHTKMKDGPEMRRMFFNLDTVPIPGGGASLVPSEAGPEAIPVGDLVLDWLKDVSDATTHTSAQILTGLKTDMRCATNKRTVNRKLADLVDAGKLLRSGTDAKPLYALPEGS